MSHNHIVGVLAENPFTAMTFLRTTANSSSTDNGVPDIQIMYAATPMGGVNPFGLMSRVFTFLNASPFVVKIFHTFVMYYLATNCRLLA